ncbi:serendipity locus protein beta [Scaptodrosophila lebanonensis]|uniref:Serendipity locus protein beta n=1 Tax=Drosophila lebanonensis TaxID=7225 RepID=A0A6J2T0F2_DROLE|nr:serendipity locus protein beta [Scaptodrosophila lebanonensis]
MSRPHCFVCGIVKAPGGVPFQIIENCIVPGTFKPIKVIIKHFEKVIHQPLDLTPTSAACKACLEYLFNYDRLARHLSQVQSKIANSMVNCRRPIAQKRKLDTSQKEEAIQPEKAAKQCTQSQKQTEDCHSKSATEDEIESGTDHETFTDETRLDKHYDEDDSFQDVRYDATCNICGIKVRDEEVLDLHMNIHEGKSELECRYCSKKFSQKRSVLRHMQVHSDKKKFQCEKCGECFSISWLMYNHRMLHDAEENALICDVCKQQFKTKRTYTQHLRTHQADRPRYQCTDCNKSFVDKYTLKVHMRVHNSAGLDTEKKANT